jgi:threonine/homoserine/homoserine lactone efflux protein
VSISIFSSAARGRRLGAKVTDYTSTLVTLGSIAVVALALSSAQPRSRYLRAKTAIDRTTAAVLGLLGIKLVLAPEWSALLSDAG